MTPQEAIEKKVIKFGKMENMICSLNRNRPYYYQNQGQLFLTGRKFCYFGVWTTKGFVYERIKPDTSLWSEMFPKLRQFYMENCLPILLKEKLYNMVS